jgi:hypothetical protein
VNRQAITGENDGSGIAVVFLLGGRIFIAKGRATNISANELPREQEPELICPNL